MSSEKIIKEDVLTIKVKRTKYAHSTGYTFTSTGKEDKDILLYGGNCLINKALQKKKVRVQFDSY